ncbi:MAG: hypothetical protein C4325_07435 [Blastocatellia bacterium]
MKPIWPDISHSLKARIESVGRRRTYVPDEIIYLEGEQAEFLPIVMSGRVKICHPYSSGQEVIIALFASGEAFGIPPVFDREPYPASAFAMDETTILAVDRTDAVNLFAESNEFAFAIVECMCRMLRDKTAIIQSLATASAERRVASVLLRLAENTKTGVPIRVTLRRREIAEMAGLATETAIRTTGKLAARGLLKIERGKIIVEATQPLRDFLAK